MTQYGWWSPTEACQNGFYLFTDKYDVDYLPVTLVMAEPYLPTDYDDYFYVGRVQNKALFVQVPTDGRHGTTMLRRLWREFETPIPPKGKKQPRHIRRKITYIDLEL